MNKPFSILPVLFLLFSCHGDSKNPIGKMKYKIKHAELKLLCTVNIACNREKPAFNSKIAVSDSVLLIQYNQLYHSVYRISDSSKYLFVNGKKKDWAMSFDSCLKKYKLRSYSATEFITKKNDLVDIKNFDCKRPGILKFESEVPAYYYYSLRQAKDSSVFQYYHEKDSTNAMGQKYIMEVCTKDNSVKFEIICNKLYNYSTFELRDLTGDGIEEILVFDHIFFDYMGDDTYRLSVYQLLTCRK